MTRRNLNLSKTRGRILGVSSTGVIGSLIPSTGENGPGYLYPSLSLPADANTEVCGTITVLPTAGVFAANEDSSFTFSGAPDGSYFATFQVKVDGILTGAPRTLTLNVGSALTCTPGNAAAGGPTATIGLTVPASVGNAAAGGPTALVNQGVSCAVGNASAVGPIATVYQGLNILASVGNATAGGPFATINRSIGCTVSNATCGGPTASIQQNGIHVAQSCTVEFAGAINTVSF